MALMFDLVSRSGNHAPRVTNHGLLASRADSDTIQRTMTRSAWRALRRAAGMLAVAGILWMPVVTLASELSPSIVPSLGGVYSYQPTIGGVIQELVEENETYRLYRVRIPASVRSGIARDRWVLVDYYQPQQPPPYQAVVMLPHLSGGMRIERYMCRGFARQGIAALHVQAPYHMLNPFEREADWLGQAANTGDLVEIVQLVRQAVIDARQVADWLDRQPQIAPKHYGIMGISFGGNVAVLVAGVDRRFGSAAYLLSGGDMARLVKESDVTLRVRNRLQEKGISAEDVGRIWCLIDPLNAAPVARVVPTIMVNAKFDQTIPKACSDALWQALGQPSQIWLVADHTSASLYAYFVRFRLIRHFRDTLL